MHVFSHMDYKTHAPIPLPLLPLIALSVILSELCLSIKRQPLDLHYVTLYDGEAITGWRQCLVNTHFWGLYTQTALSSCSCSSDVSHLVIQEIFFCFVHSNTVYSLFMYGPALFPTAVTVFLFLSINHLAKKSCCTMSSFMGVVFFSNNNWFI